MKRKLLCFLLALSSCSAFTMLSSVVHAATVGWVSGYPVAYTDPLYMTTGIKSKATATVTGAWSTVTDITFSISGGPSTPPALEIDLNFTGPGSVTPPEVYFTALASGTYSCSAVGHGNDPGGSPWSASAPAQNVTI